MPLIMYRRNHELSVENDCQAQSESGEWNEKKPEMDFEGDP